MELKKKKRVLLEDEALYWLQIWMMASSLKKVNKHLKDFFPNDNRNTVTYHNRCKI